MSLLYCVIHTELQKDREENILSTWGQNKNIVFYGDYDIPGNEFLLKVSNRSDYASGEEKQINAVSILPKNYNHYDWYYFCDNDTFVNTKLLEEFYIDCEEDKIYAEISNTWPEDRTLFYPMGGAGFLMSNKMLNFLSDKVVHHSVPWGDVSIGLNFRKLNIQTVNREDIFHSQPPEFYNIPYEQIKNHISFHYIKDKASMKFLLGYC